MSKREVFAEGFLRTLIRNLKRSVASEMGNLAELNATPFCQLFLEERRRVSNNGLLNRSVTWSTSMCAKHALRLEAEKERIVIEILEDANTLHQQFRRLEDSGQWRKI